MRGEPCEAGDRLTDRSQVDKHQSQRFETCLSSFENSRFRSRFQISATAACLRISSFTSTLNKQLRKASHRLTRTAIKQSSHPDYPDRRPFLKITPQQLMAGPIFRLRTGHTRCLNHFKRLNIVQDDACRCCNQASETVDHIFFHCPELRPIFGPFRRWCAEAPEERKLPTLIWTKPKILEKLVIKALKAGAGI